MELAVILDQLGCFDELQKGSDILEGLERAETDGNLRNFAKLSRRLDLDWTNECNRMRRQWQSYQHARRTVARVKDDIERGYVGRGSVVMISVARTVERFGC